MKRWISILAAALLIVPCFASAETAELSAAPLTFVQMLYQGDYQAVYDQSTPEVQAGLGSPEGFAAVWMQLEQQLGAFEEIRSDSVQEQAGYTVGTIVCAYAAADVTFTVAVDSGGLLAGLNVTAVTPKTADSVADQTQFSSEPITLRTGEADETQGLLTLPGGDGPFPAVIMMQGSGPSDMNETAYGIAPFRDLAEGLAVAGVASIRYDKYSYAHADLLQADPELLSGFTVTLEYIADARDALTLLQADERIGDIYLLGHSLGGMILPRVMETLGAEQFAGGIMMAASPLALWEISYHQNLMLLERLSEDDRPAAQAALDAEAARLEDVLALSDDELKAATFFGASAYYQKDLMSVDNAQAAVKLQKPLLIIQGGKDWQVTPEDGINQWQALFAGQSFATYLHYPDMNHMLCDMAGESAGDTSDYLAGDTVSQELILDIASWILQ